LAEEETTETMQPSSGHGVLVLDKPPGLTSRAVVDRAKGWFPRGTRLGHTGTLDPLASGVLVLCIGAATRLAEYVQRMAKTYRTRILLGARSDTDDADGNITPAAQVVPPGRPEIEEALGAFVGEIDQVPPPYSAVRVTGRRAYDLVRKGKSVNLPPRRVQVHAIDMLSYVYPHLELAVRCGKGTYIRALARDLGERLGCGGLVEKLRRTQVGPFTESAAVTMEAGPAAALTSLLPLAAAVTELPQVRVSSDQARRLAQGQGVLLKTLSVSANFHVEREVAVLGEWGSLVAVARVDTSKGMLLPEKGFLHSLIPQIGN
jgi:tRNA pseudouridine55 synthase